MFLFDHKNNINFVQNGSLFAGATRKKASKCLSATKKTRKVALMGCGMRNNLLLSLLLLVVVLLLLLLALPLRCFPVKLAAAEEEVAMGAEPATRRGVVG